jgi:SAM-dependent methyltransferase
VRRNPVNLSNATPTPYRLWYNDFLVEHFVYDLKVIDIGKSLAWDYSRLWSSYTSLDIDPTVGPDILGDITSSIPSSLEHSFDVALCNGVYEYVSQPDSIFARVYDLLRSGGIALFGLVGPAYPLKIPGSDGSTLARFDRSNSSIRNAGFETHMFFPFGDEYFYVLAQRP